MNVRRAFAPAVLLLALALAAGCASPPSPEPAPAPEPSGRTRPDQWYDLHLQGWDEAEVEEIMGAIKSNAAADGWAKIEEKSNKGDFHAYRVGYTGGEAKTAIRAYLKEANLHEKFRVETNGDKAKELVITKK